jgi:hypothetical protein
MFELDLKLKALDVAPSAVLEIHHSLNTAEVATKEFVGEPAKAYICLMSLVAQRQAIYISFFFPNKNRAIFYSCSDNPFSPTRTEEVKEEAMLFLESFGFILEQVVGVNSPPKDRDYWIARVPFFKSGAPAGEIILRSSTSSSPSDGASQLIISSDLIRDSKGDMVANGTKIKVGTNLGVLSTLEGESHERQVVIPTTEGMVTFLLKSPAQAGKAVITAVSEEGSALGELTIDFLPLDPAGEIKLEVVPPRPYADGQTLVTIQSQPVGDSLGNIVEDGTPFSIGISDQQRVLSSLQVTSQKGIIRHKLMAPSTPVTMLISAKSQKGQAQGELVLTFEAPVPLISETPPPPEAAPKELTAPIPPAEVTLPSKPEEPSPAAAPSPSPSPVAAEPTEEFVFHESPGSSAVEWVGITALPTKTEAENKKTPPLAKETLPAPPVLKEKPAAVSQAFPQAKVSEPPGEPKEIKPPKPFLEGPSAVLPSEQPPFSVKVSPSWEPYQELIRFLTRT